MVTIPGPSERALRVLRAWVAVVVLGGLLAALGHHDAGDRAGAFHPPAPTTTTLPPQQLVIGRIDTSLVVHVTTVDPTTRYSVPSDLPPGPQRGVGPLGGRVVVDDHTTTSPLRTTCGFAGCQTGSTTVRASDLSIIDPDGTTRVLTSGGYDREPQWSPAGDVIAYISHRGTLDGKEVDVAALITPQGARLATLTPPGMIDTSLAFSPDGSEVAVFRRLVDHYGDGSVVIVPTAGGPERTIATGRYSELAWSPDGRSIAAVGERVAGGQGYPDGYPVARDLWVLHPDGSPPVRLTSYDPKAAISGWSASFCGSSGGWFAQVQSPVWSRDGQLAFLTNHLHLERFGRVFDVALADLTGAGAHQVVFASPPDTCQGSQTTFSGPTYLYGWA